MESLSSEAFVSRPVSHHYRTITVFSVIGGSVFLVGMAGMYLQVSVLGINPLLAFLIMSIFSIELSFVLNKWITWRDRQTGFWVSFRRFNASRFVTVPVSQGFYALLLWVGVNYLIAVVINTAVFTVVNYFFGHFWVFPSHDASPTPGSKGENE
jgi:putative flippase GtrA